MKIRLNILDIKDLDITGFINRTNVVIYFN